MSELRWPASRNDLILTARGLKRNEPYYVAMAHFKSLFDDAPDDLIPNIMGGDYPLYIRVESESHYE